MKMHHFSRQSRFDGKSNIQLLELMLEILRELQHREDELFRLQNEEIRPKTDYEEEV